MTINGENVSGGGKTIAELLAQEGYRADRVAVEMNGEIVPRAEYATIIPAEDAAIEVVRFVGGG